MEFQAVVLAAGQSKRAGAQKLLASFRRRRLLDYAIDAARQWHPIVVAGCEVARELAVRTDITVIHNAEPERGMAHSLRLANAATPPNKTLIVFLGDKPLVTPQLVEQLCGLEAEIVHPVHAESGEPGHPVLFRPAVRLKIASLPDGDTLNALRDDPAFTRFTLATLEVGAFFDLDDVPPDSVVERTIHAPLR